MSISNLSSALFSVATLINRGPSLLGECLSAIAACTTMAQLDQLSSDFRTNGSVFTALAPADKAIVKVAGQTRRMLVTMASIPGPVVAVAPVAPVSIVANLAQISTESIANAASVRRRGRPSGPRVMTEAQIAEASRIARLAGTALAGYAGQVVTPTTGMGSIITLRRVSKRDVVVDSLTGRKRQSLIKWSDVESARIALNLEKGAFGRIPGDKGLLGAATAILNHGGFVAKHAGTGAGKYVTAWKIGYFDSDLDSDSMGQREALITLDHAGNVVTSNPDHPGSVAVIADYLRRQGETLIASDDLSRRIVNCLEAHYSARDTDLGLYVPPFHADRVKAFVETIRPIAGRKIAHFVVTSSEGFATALSDALTDSIDDSITALEKTIAKKSGEATSASLLTECERIRSEIAGLSSTLGAETVAAFNARITVCDAQAVKGLDLRTAMLELS